MNKSHHYLRLPFILILIALTPAVQAAAPDPNSDYPLVVYVTDETTFWDTIRFADHTSSPMEGNWITLGGGTDIALPQISMKYNGVTEATFTHNTNKVTIKTHKLNTRTTNYPPSTHQVHTPSQTIAYTFHGSKAHAYKTVSVRVIPVTPTELRDAASDAFKGDTDAIKSLLSNSVHSSTEKLDKNGDLAKTIGTLPAGDYVLVIVDETAGNPYSLDIYSVAAIEVLDYPSTVTIPSSITRGKDLEVQVQLTGAGAASRRYGAVVIQQAKYKVDLVLTCDGTTEGTSLTGRGALLVEGTPGGFSLAGVGLKGIDKDQILDMLKEAYTAAEFSAAFTEYTSEAHVTVPVTTTGLIAGKFIVLVGVWESGSNKVVAFHQGEVTVKGPPAPVIPVVIPPALTPAQIMAMGDAEAAAALAAMSPSQAATLVNQITPQKAAAIFSKMPTAVAAAIVKEMQTKAAAAAMNEADNGVVVRVLAAMDSAKAAAVLGEMTVGKAARVLEEAVNAGKESQFGAYMNMLNHKQAAEILQEIAPQAGAKIVEEMTKNDIKEAAKRVESTVKLRLGEKDPAKAKQMLRRIVETLQKADTGTLVSIFVEIANLPETPSTVAAVMEAMDKAKALDVVSRWVSIGNLGELGLVFSHFTEGFISEAWSLMVAAERTTLFTHLPPETVQLLPQVGEFQLSGLQVGPTTAALRQVVTINVTVENVGSEPGTYTLALKINGVSEATRKLVLALGQRQTVEWTVSRSQAGTYSVDVNGLTASFIVQPTPRPASFTLRDLTVSPTRVKPGDPVTVTATVRNTGGLTGSTPVKLMINGEPDDTATVTLNPVSSTTVSFAITRDREGTYVVVIGDMVSTFTVVAPPPPSVPWAAVLAAVVVVTAVGYIIYSQRRSEAFPGPLLFFQ